VRKLLITFSLLISTGLAWSAQTECKDHLYKLIFYPSKEKVNQFIPDNLSKKIKNLQQTISAPKILMAATEFGTLNLGGKEVTAKVGGLAVVVNDMIKNLPGHLKSHGGGEVGFVFMGYEGVPTGKLVTQFDIKVANNNHHVELYEEVLGNGARIFILKNPVFERRSITSQNRNLYVNNPDLPLLSGREEWEDAYILSLYNQAIAKVHSWYGSNIYHAHDSHTLLATKFINTENVVSTTIHNAGPGYQGVYWTHNFGHHRDFSNPAYVYGIPTGDYQANDHLLSILGFTHDEYMRLVEEDGMFNTFKLLHHVEKHNGIAGSPVSDGYAKELGLSKDALIGEIYKQKNATPSNIDNIYIPNDDKYLGTMDGIENGLSDSAKAFKHPFLQKKSEEELKEIHPIITDESIKRLWLKDLSYGKNLNTNHGKQNVHSKKAILKEALQKTLGMEVAPNKPLFVTVARIVDQKNIAIFVENIEHIVRNGGQVVIGGRPGDQVGLDTAQRIEQIINLLPKDLQRQVKFVNAFVNKEIGVLIQGGGDFFVLTSKFEPCGLTDIEASWLGTIIVSRKTGGLGKVKNGFYYQWADSSDFYGESNEAGKAISKAIELYKNDYSSFLKMRIAAMREDFSWDIAFSKYINNYHASSFFKVQKEASVAAKSGQITYSNALNILKDQFQKLPSATQKNYIRLLKKKPAHTLLEREIIEIYEHFGKWKGLTGTNIHKHLGAHPSSKDSYSFKIWIPEAKEVKLITSRYGWDNTFNLEQDKQGIWSIDLKGIKKNDQYKFIIDQGDGVITERVDPLSRFTTIGDHKQNKSWHELNGGSWHSVVTNSKFKWTDKGFKASIKPRIMEVHPGTIIPGKNDATWTEIGDYIIPMLKESKINFVQLMPVSHHNVYESWGYQPGSFFSPDFRHGTPKQLKELINRLHKNNIAVSFDLVLGHMSKDTDTGLSSLGKNGSAVYEKNGHMGEHPNWGTKVFDFSKETTRSYLLSFGRMLVEEFHIDGYRVDAVASMINLNFGRENNFDRYADGDIIDQDAVRFIQDFNHMMHSLKPEILAIAEESHSFNGVTKPFEEGGLDFDFKWEMGGMHHLRKYAKAEKSNRHIFDIFKAIEWDQAPHVYNEKQIHYVNSHDEVSHPGKYFLDTIKGLKSESEQFDWGRMIQGHISVTMPGRSMSFMGDQFANKGDNQLNGWAHTWDHQTYLNVHLTEQQDDHNKFKKFFINLGNIIQNEPALNRTDSDSAKILKMDDQAQVGVVARINHDIDDKDTLVTILNTSDNNHLGYHIELPVKGKWKVILNSNKLKYGGSGHKVKLENIDIQSGSIKLNIPARSFLVLKRES
jgi:1,4-alpha-glucan branching enzyme